MEVRHVDPDLEDAERNPDYRGGLDHVRVRGLRKVLNIVRSVPNETELRKYAGLRFKKLERDRSHQHSLRINDQWRVIVEIEKRRGSNNNVCAVISVTDYHN